MATNFPKPKSARDIMATKLITLAPDADVFDGIDLLIKHRISGAPVVDANQKLLGLFTEMSCMKVLINAAYEQLPTSRVDAFMDSNPITISEDTDILSITQLFVETQRRRLPVIRDGKVVGQVSRRDVIRAVSELMHTTPERKSVLLYLSALKNMDEAPEV